MENLFGVLLILGLELYGSGAVFFRALEYIEGRRFRRRWAVRLAAIPASGLLTLLTCWMMRGLSCFSAHPVAEAAASLFVAAMLASAFSAVRPLLLRRGKMRRPLRKREHPPCLLMREQVRRAG